MQHVLHAEGSRVQVGGAEQPHANGVPLGKPQHMQRKENIPSFFFFRAHSEQDNMASQTVNVPADAQDVPAPEGLQTENRERGLSSNKQTPSKILDSVPNLARLFRLVVKRVAWQWEKLATTLELDNDGRKIDAIRRDFWGVGVEICCMQAIHHWVRGEGKGPVSWRTLLKCLKDIECAQIAEDIEKQLAG